MTHQSHTQLALIEAKKALEAGSRRPPEIELPHDPELATACVLAVIRGDSLPITQSQALAQLAERKQAALATDKDAAFDEIARSIPVMEAMYLRYSALAVQEGNIDRQFRLTKMASQCHAAMIRSIVSIHGLKTQRKNPAPATVIVHDDGDGSGDGGG